MMLTRPIVTTLALTLAACASHPDKMSPTYVSPMRYHGYDCEQIAMEGANIEREVSKLYETLKSESDADTAQMAAGLIILWPTLFFLEGGDGPRAAEYKQLLGEYDALETAGVQKKCGLQFQLPDFKKEAEAEEEKNKKEVHPSDQSL